jgi:hypothetical protein
MISPAAAQERDIINEPFTKSLLGIEVYHSSSPADTLAVVLRKG